jgi:hypothetical protein
MSDAGVVDPIRLPEPFERLVRRIPLLAWVFIGLTALDLLGRLIGVLSSDIYVSLDDPLSLLTWILPHDALILLPALVVIRRHDAATATPWVMGGAMVVALVELLRRPTESIFSGGIQTGSAESIVGFALVGPVATAVGWIVLGRGLSILNPREPAAQIRGLANVGAALVIVAAAVNWFAFVVESSNLESLDLNGSLVVLDSVAAVSSLGWAYLVRAVLLGRDDPNRSILITRLAALGVLISAIAGLTVAVLTAVASANIQVVVNLEIVLGVPIVDASALGVTMVVGAFGLGLADPLRPMAKEWDEASSRGVVRPSM